MTYLTLILIGLLAGIAGGLFGVGGGTVFVPLLMLWRGFDVHMAIGTSIAAIVPTAIIAAIRHGQGDMIAWKTVGFLVIFAMIGAWLGSSLSLKLNVDVLRKLYAVFLLVISIKIFFQN